MDLHRIRLSRLRRIRPHLRPGPDETHVRAQRVVPLRRGRARLSRPLHLVLGQDPGQHLVDHERLVQRRLHLYPVRRADAHRTERQEGTVLRPATGGAATGTIAGQTGYGKTVGLPFDGYALFGTDRALVWWNGDITASTQAVNIVGKGAFMYMDGGKRLGYADFSKSEPKFFAPAGAVAEAAIAAEFPDGVIPPVPPGIVPFEHRHGIASATGALGPRCGSSSPRSNQ